MCFVWGNHLREKPTEATFRVMRYSKRLYCVSQCSYIRKVGYNPTDVKESYASLTMELAYRHRVPERTIQYTRTAFDSQVSTPSGLHTDSLPVETAPWDDIPHMIAATSGIPFPAGLLLEKNGGDELTEFHFSSRDWVLDGASLQNSEFIANLSQARSLKHLGLVVEVGVVSGLVGNAIVGQLKQAISSHPTIRQLSLRMTTAVRAACRTTGPVGLQYPFLSSELATWIALEATRLEEIVIYCRDLIFTDRLIEFMEALAPILQRDRTVRLTFHCHGIVMLYEKEKRHAQALDLVESIQKTMDALPGFHFQLALQRSATEMDGMMAKIKTNGRFVYLVNVPCVDA